MGRPPLEIGTYGKIRFKKVPTGYRARAAYRGNDGVVCEMERSGSSKSKAERELKLAINREIQTPSGAEINSNTRFHDVAQQWFKWQERRAASGERAPGTIDNYRSVLKNHVLPAMGELRLYEVTVPGWIGSFRHCRLRVVRHTHVQHEQLLAEFCVMPCAMEGFQ